MTGNLSLAIMTGLCAVQSIILVLAWLNTRRLHRESTAEIRAAVNFAVQMPWSREGILFLRAFDEGDAAHIERRYPDWYNFRTAFLLADREVL